MVFVLNPLLPIPGDALGLVREDRFELRGRQTHPRFTSWAAFKESITDWAGGTGSPASPCNGVPQLSASA